uniref:Small ribosomal subunit protein uS2c n=1 Tax=Chlorotetraedron incus TaxID=162317 RepID=A0A140HA99_9CHLO|nr:ribosomal protein S2 [Chlorotetraedron incus]AMO01098.1 ribosomal protein S2 [Chlorotetraedron incus]
MQTNQKRRINNGTKNGSNQRSLGVKVSSKIKLGDVFSLKINGLGPKKMGLVELNNGLTVLVPNANLGDFVKVKLEKILSTRKQSNTKAKFAIASIIQILKKGNKASLIPKEVQVGNILSLTIKKKGPKNSGFAQLAISSSDQKNADRNFTIIVPNAKVGQTANVQITKIKSTYAFGKVVVDSTKEGQSKKSIQFGSEASKRHFENVRSQLSGLTKNKKYHIVLPSNAKSISNFFVLKFNGNLLFVKKSLGIELGDHVKIQMIRVREAFSIAKVVNVLQKGSFSDSNSVTGKLERQKMVKTQVKKMIESGMHFGERAIRCNANMRSYIWLRKKGKNKNRPFLKRGRHVINLLKTRRCLKKALTLLSKYAANGQTFLFVGTKKPAASLIARTAVLSQTSFFVNTRWLGGMLTNWKTILKSISQIRPILKEKQKVIQNLLEKRQKIKDRLLRKVNLLRKKSRKLMLKGKKFILQLQQNPNNFILKSKKLIQKKRVLLIQNKNLIERYSALNMKEEKIFQQIDSLKEKGNQLLEQKQYLKNQILNDKKKLQEFKQLFLIGQELMKVKNYTKSDGKVLWAVSYEKFNQLMNETSTQNEIWMVPSPSVEIFNKIIATMKMKFDPNSFSDIVSQQMNRSKSTTQETNTIILSKLLDKFTLYLPFMKKYMQMLVQRLQNSQKLLEKLYQDLQQIREKLTVSVNLANQIQNELTAIRSKLLQQQKLFKVLKTKLRLLSSEQRLLKFLPKLRYLPTTKNKMYERVELLMKKFVDPKMSYPMDLIYDQKLKYTSKKIAATRKQKWQRLEKYFGGVTQMSKMSKQQISNNVAIIVGQQEEMNAVRECQKLGIKMFTIVDTNCNPKMADHIIPANDDSRTSIQYILGQMLTHIRLAQKLRRKVAMKKSFLRLV